LDISAHTPTIGHIIERLYTIYPTKKTTPENEKVPEGSSEWPVLIRAINDSDECTAENFSNSCRGYTLHFVVSDDLLGGRRFAFKAGPAFFIRVVSFEQIPAESNGGRSCVLFTLEERVKVNPKAPRWEEKITHICATPRGFVKYRPPAGTKP